MAKMLAPLPNIAAVLAAVHAAPASLTGHVAALEGMSRQLLGPHELDAPASPEPSEHHSPSHDLTDAGSGKAAVLGMAMLRVPGATRRHLQMRGSMDKKRCTARLLA